MTDLVTPEPESTNTLPQNPEPESKKTRQMGFHFVPESGEIVAHFDGLEPLTLAVSEVPPALQSLAISEGLISRTRSATSKHQGDERTAENLRNAVQAAFENLRNGVWKIEREATEAEYPVEIIAAFEFRKGKALSAGKDFTDTLADVAEMWQGLTETQQKQIRSLPRYQAAYAAEKARRSAAKAARLLAKAEKEEAAAAL
jgi:hypothetical protein